MSEETLRRFLEQLNADASFRGRMQEDAAGAFAEFDLSPVEQMAIMSGDEDALRRLTGLDVSGYAGQPETAVGSATCGWCGTINCPVLPGPLPLRRWLP
jgi:hypothetical protein